MEKLENIEASIRSELKSGVIYCLECSLTSVVLPWPGWLTAQPDGPGFKSCSANVFLITPGFTAMATGLITCWPGYSSVSAYFFTIWGVAALVVYSVISLLAATISLEFCFLFFFIYQFRSNRAFTRCLLL